MKFFLKKLGAVFFFLGLVSILTFKGAGAQAPQIFSPAPKFSLPDLSGKQVRLSDYKNKKNVLIVFYRGWVGYWWPFCQRQLVQLLRDYEAFKKLETEILFVSPSELEKSKEFLAAAKVPISFPVLIDPEREVVKLYHVMGERAIPSLFVIDKKGVLRFKYISQNAADRPPTRHILEMLQVISAQPVKGEN